MEVISIGLVCLLILLVIGFVYLIVIYNSLVTLKVTREQAFADIDVQMKQRYDLVPNLVNTVKGYATHEKELLENITKARTSAMSAGSIDEKIKAENQFNATLKTLFAVAENYPDLKANQNFLQLQTELSDIENKIAAARRFFNNATKEYNAAIVVFPNSLIASLMKMQTAAYFDLGEEKEAVSKPVEVKF